MVVIRESITFTSPSLIRLFCLSTPESHITQDVYKRQVYVAVGVFCSSLTDSVIIAGITSIIFSLMLWFVAWGSSMAESPFAQAVLNHMAVTHHFGNLAKGSIEFSGILFHLSVVALYCFLTQRVVESHRWR